MGNIWDISVWGVRGGNPVPDADFLEYGGNTACILASYGDCMAVLDAGSGLVGLGKNLQQAGRKRVDILLGHLHMDHVIGLFTFPLLHDTEANIHLYSEERDGVSFQRQLETLIGAPYWPLSFRDFRAKVTVHEIKVGDSFSIPKSCSADENGGSIVPSSRLADADSGNSVSSAGQAGENSGNSVSSAGQAGGNNGITVSTLRAKHPNQCLLYRLEAGGKSIVYALDCEMDKQMFSELSYFSKNCDLLIWDANFTGTELKFRKGWGHSSWEDGIALRRAAGAKKVLMTHFSSNYNDTFLRGQERLAKLADTSCAFAKEGMTIQL